MGYGTGQSHIEVIDKKSCRHFEKEKQGGFHFLLLLKNIGFTSVLSRMDSVIIPFLEMYGSTDQNINNIAWGMLHIWSVSDNNGLRKWKFFAQV